MAVRSIRNRIRYNLESARKHAEAAMVSLKLADELSEDRVDEIKAHLPAIVYAFQTVADALSALRDRC